MRQNWGDAPPPQRKPNILGVMVVVVAISLGLMYAGSKPAALAEGAQRSARQAANGKSLADLLPKIDLPGFQLPSLHGRGTSSTKVEKAVAFAMAQRNKPYRYGQAGPWAYDCSGLTQVAWRKAGVNLPRTAKAQYQRGPRATGGLRRGDLVFFRSSGPSGWHMGMVIGPNKMVEAANRHDGIRTSTISGRDFIGATRPGGR